MDLGELVGSLRLEDSQFGQALSGALDKLSAFAPKGAKIAGAAGVAIALGFTASLVQNLSMDAANDKLAAQLGLSEAESKRVGGVAGKLYADAYGDSLEDVNTAVAAVMTSIDGMATASSSELEDVTARALDFATAFDVDVTRAAQLAGQTVKNGLAKDATEGFDLLVAASQAVGPALQGDLLDAVDEYGPAFAQLGYSGEQAFAMLVDGADKGMYGIDKTGDAMKELTIRATDMSTASQDAYGAIGLDAEEMSNQLLAGGDSAKAATDKIILGLLGIEDPSERANTSIALFGTPLEDLSTAGIPKFLTAMQGGSDSMDGFAGASDRMGETLNGNAMTSLKSIKRQAELFFVGLSNGAVGPVTAIADKMATGFGPAMSAAGDLIVWVTEKSDALFGPLGGNSAVLTTLAAVIGGVLVGALIIWGTQAIITSTRTAVLWTVTQAGAARSAAATVLAAGLIVGGWILMGAQAMLGAARMAAAWLIALGPIGLVIAAIAGIVIVIVKNWDTIKAKTAAAWDWVVSKVRGVPGMLVGFFMNFTLPGLIIKHFDRIKAGVSRGVDSVVGFVKGLPRRLLSAVGNLGSLLWGVGGDIMSGLMRGIEAGFGWVRSKLSGVGRLIPGWLKSVLGINSPSKVMRDEVGQWIPAGIAEGIDRGASKFLDPALDRMTAAASMPITAGGMFQASVAGLSAAADREARDTLASLPGTGGGPLVEQHIYPQPGMSEKQVGDHAGNRLAFALQNG